MRLTRRQTEVLWLLDARLSNTEIAAVLRIAPEAVKSRASRIYRKLMVCTRRETVDPTRVRLPRTAPT